MHRLRSVLLRQHLVHAAPGASVYEAAHTMVESRVGAIAILDDEHLVGIFSERDLMTRVLVPRRDADRTPVSEVMTREIVTADVGDHIDDCLEKMRAAGCRHLPVLVDGRVIAMVSMRDLLRDEIEEQGQEIRHLRAYLHQTPV